MKYRILHESSYRMRVHMACGTMTIGQADFLEYHLKKHSVVREVKVFPHLGNVVIRYERTERGRGQILHVLCDFSFCETGGKGRENREQTFSTSGSTNSRTITVKYQKKILRFVASNLLRRLLLPSQGNLLVMARSAGWKHGLTVHLLRETEKR